jgi:hypothetical protein
VESPDNGQPELPQTGLYSAVPLMSWPSAMKVSAAVCEAVTLADAIPGDEAAALVAGAAGVDIEVAGTAGVAGVPGVLAAADADDAAELADELQAVTSKAAQASPAQAAAGRARCEFVVHMISNPSTQLAALRAMSPLRRPPCRHGCGQRRRRVTTNHYRIVTGSVRPNRARPPARSPG